MADLDKRSSYTPRRTREQRAFRLVQVGGVSAAVAVVGFILSIIGVISFAIPFFAAVIAVICVVLFRSTVGKR